MTAYLLDTNVLSETVKRRPHPHLVAWISRQPTASVCVLTFGELLQGARRLRRRDAVHADRLETWIAELRETYTDRTLPIDDAVIDRWATLPVVRTLPVIDSLIAATALAHGLTVATRNVQDFTDAGVPTVNPFA